MSLITSVSELKKYVAVDVNLKWNTISPYVDEAEQLYIKDLLGEAFYNSFHTLYQASLPPTNTALSSDNAKLLPYIQRALAYYSQLQAIPNLTVTFGDLGIRQHRAEDSDAAPRWKEEKLLFNALKNGDIHADKLLEFLELNATASNDFQNWFTSPANTKMSGYLVYSTEVASKFIRINNSRRVYLALCNTIKELEPRFIPKLVGKAQYDELVTQLQAGTTTATNLKLVEKVQPIIAKRSLFMQLQFMRVQINENGLFIYSGTDDFFDIGQLATDADIKILRHQLMDGELGYVADEAELRQFILDNIDDYPLIKTTGIYTIASDPGPGWLPSNDPCNKHFSV